MSASIAELLGSDGLDRVARGAHPPGSVGLFDTQGRGAGQPLGYLGPFLAAALMASYVLYGFDTAGTLAEETDLPRRRAPWAILQALAAAGTGRRACSCSSASSRSATRAEPELGRISGGLPFLVKDVLGPRLGVFLLLEVIFAVFVCALAVHAGIDPADVRDGPRQQPPVRPLRSPTSKRGQRHRSSRPSWSACWPRRSWS